MNAWAAALAMLVGTAALAGDREIGVLPDSARKVAENRYKAVGDYEAVMKHYKTALPASNYPRKPIVNQPGIKAIHIANPSGKGGWEGMNIYENNDEVRIYVVVGAESGKKKKTK
jgi:hypothetical protein